MRINRLIFKTTAIILIQALICINLSWAANNADRAYLSPRVQIDNLQDVFEAVGALKQTPPVFDADYKFITLPNVKSGREIQLYVFKRDKVDALPEEIKRLTNASLNINDDLSVIIATKPSKDIFQTHPKILSIGGGTAIGKIVAAFENYNLLPSDEPIMVMVTNADDGGSTGRVQKLLKLHWNIELPPIGDLITALTRSLDDWQRAILDYRFKHGENFCQDGLRRIQAEIKMLYPQVADARIDSFCRKMDKLLEVADEELVKSGIIYLPGGAHSLKNMLFLGQLLETGAIGKNLLDKEKFYQAVIKIKELLGINALAVFPKFGSHYNATAAVRLADEDMIHGVKTREIVGQAKITSAEHTQPYVKFEFRDKDNQVIKPEADPEVIAMIDNIPPEGTIIIGPGSLFTSILANLCVGGVASALIRAKQRGVKVMFIFNISLDIETYGHDFASIVKVIEDSVGYKMEEIASYVVVNDHKFNQRDLKLLAKERTVLEKAEELTRRKFFYGPLAPDEEMITELKQKGVIVLQGNFGMIGEMIDREPGKVAAKTRHAVHDKRKLAFSFVLMDMISRGIKPVVVADKDDTFTRANEELKEKEARQIIEYLELGEKFVFLSSASKPNMEKHVLEVLLKHMKGKRHLLQNLYFAVNSGAAMYRYAYEPRTKTIKAERIYKITLEGELKKRGFDYHAVYQEVEGIIRTIIEKYQLTPKGKYIDERPSQLTFVPSGLDKEAKAAYSKQENLDERIKYAEEINEMLMARNIPLRARVGGETSVDIVLYDKGDMIKLIAEKLGIPLEAIIYFGDSFGPWGGDEPVMRLIKVLINVGKMLMGVPVDNVLITARKKGPPAAREFMEILTDVIGQLREASRGLLGVSKKDRRINGRKYAYEDKIDQQTRNTLDRLMPRLAGKGQGFDLIVKILNRMNNPAGFDPNYTKRYFNDDLGHGLLHGLKVLEYALNLTETLEQQGAEIDYDTLIAGALLHDSAVLADKKLEWETSIQGRRVTGFTRQQHHRQALVFCVAALLDILSHHKISKVINMAENHRQVEDPDNASWEEKILYDADTLVGALDLERLARMSLDEGYDRPVYNPALTPQERFKKLQPGGERDDKDVIDTILHEAVLNRDPAIYHTETAKQIAEGSHNLERILADINRAVNFLRASRAVNADEAAKIIEDVRYILDVKLNEAPAYPEEPLERYGFSEKEGKVILEDREFGSSITVDVANGNNITAMTALINGKPVSILDERGMPIMWPFANRIEAAGSEIFNSQLVSRDNETLKTIRHGMVRKLPWTIEGHGIDQEGIFFIASVDSDDYPNIAEYFAASRITVTYRLKGNTLSVDTHVKNKDTYPLTMSLGFHPWFKTSDIATTKVRLPAGKRWIANDDYLPQGRPVAAEGKYDFREAQPIGNNLYDDVFTDLEAEDNGYIHTEIVDEKNNVLISLKASSHFQHFVLYNPAGENVVCLEPQTSSTNPFILEKNGISQATPIRIPPGGEFKADFKIEVFDRDKYMQDNPQSFPVLPVPMITAQNEPELVLALEEAI